MAGKFQKFFVDIDLNGNKLFNTKIGANSNMGVGGAFQYNDSNNRLEYYNGSALEEIANLSDIEAITGGLIFQGGYDPTTNTPNLFSSVAGGIDPSFAYGSGFDGIILSTAIQSDGKILVVGGFSSYNGTSANKIIRLNSDGSVDTSFVYNTGFISGYDVYSIGIQSNGKIVVGGNFTNYNGTSANGIITLNSDGSIDTSFVYGTGFNGQVRSIAIQSDGKILVGGNFSAYNGTSASSIIRLNSDGSVDTSFIYGTGFDGLIKLIAIQSDGKILVGGNFSSYNGTSANKIIRLNTDGSVDTSFVYGTGFNSDVNSIAIQSDGAILVGGEFTNYNGTFAKYIIRLNSNGSIDTSFSTGSGFGGGYVLSIAIQSDGKILVGGEFTNYNGTSANGIIRLNTDGSIDTSFVYGTGFSGGYVLSIAIQPDDKILLGGGFTSYNGTSANLIVSLNSVTTTSDVLKGYFWVCSTAGDFLGESVQVGDTLIAKIDSPSATLSDWLILQGNVVVATETVDGIVRLGTQQEVLDGTESGAVVVTPATLQGKFDSNSFATTLLVANWIADTDFYYQDVTHNLDSNWFNISAFNLSNNMLCQLQVNYTDANSLRAYVNEIPTDSIVIALSRVNPTM